MTWLTREVVVTESGDASYFSIMGSFSPPFYLGIQDFDNATTGRKKKVAIFSAWDTYENNNCTNCGPETRPNAGRTTIKEIGPGVTPGQFGYEGTGVNAFINDFGWKVGDRIRAVVNLRPVADGTEISAALQINNEKWRYFGTYKYSKIYNQIGQSYSFIEDFGQTPTIVRSAEFANSWMESEDLKRVVGMTSVSASSSRGGSTTDVNTPYHRVEQRSSGGLWAQSGGNETSSTNFVKKDLEVPVNSLIPLEARIAALNISGQAQSEYEVIYRKNLEDRKIILEAEEVAARLQVAIKSYGALDSYAIYYDPDPSEATEFLTRNRFNFNTKQIRVVKSHPGTNFMINGSYGATPGFVGGVQETIEGKRQAFITVYNLDEGTCKLVTCKPRTLQKDWNVEVISSDLVTQKVEYPTHTDLYSSNITWAPGDQITWLTALSPEKDSSLLTVVVKVGTGNWQHLATIRYPAIYNSGLAGGYGGVVEPFTSNPFISRVVEYSPTVLENFSGRRSILTNLYLLGPKEKNRHSFEVNSFGLTASVGVEPQLNTQSEYRITLSKSSESPQSLEGKNLVNDIVTKLSLVATEYRQSIEAKVEAEAKAAAELKAKQEAEAKVAAELKAKQEAEAKVASDKAAAEKIVADAKAEAARILAEAKAMTKKMTITCVKGKLTKKVSAVNPKCPKGYKKK
jgi:hypothetical protein